MAKKLEPLDDERGVQLTKLLSKLPPAVKHIHAEYSGSGDSGEFDGISFLNAGNQSINVADGVTHKFEDLFDDLLIQMHYGWENGDGGRGTFSVDVDKRQIHHEHAAFYTEENVTEHHYRM